jgi:hypothetical protein
MTIARSDENANADDPIVLNDDGDSNEIDSRASQDAKQFDSRVTRPRGRTMERNEEDSNADISMACNDDGD